ncbi:MAG: nicotinate (nicotinamide) nucleotide adenylyltransferase [Desulfobacterales bacterium RIFOXYA12_FULL_46_15]|nr:MAG: nicotinate (nicotinamide) nucleotide adenylyltransferase [Desulfobacula sp. GWF2_41_7]OGR27078.1 MAG: nicotinate (nicotinamide) nucleotide adenylyltransferase [Desulfobacterales bacterium RIFOXYA12_FULL_46_15]
MKIGLFGGTFNPFHNGHIRIIEHVKDAFRLEKLFLIPSATPPHKPDTDLAPANERFDMVRQSINGREGFFVSDKELTRKGPSFTIDTLEEFKTDLGEKTDLFLLMGSDAFFDITTWRQKDQIFDLVKIIVMLRGYFKNHDAFVSFIDEYISKGYIFNDKDNSFIHTQKKTIFLCRVPRIDISSTMIRERVKHGKTIEGLVPAGVLKIIHEKELYQ